MSLKAKQCTTNTRLRLNCDMGESFGNWRMGEDERVMPLVDMANIACGFHASDPVTMTHTVQLAQQSGVTIGAHPSYPDLAGFGRRSLQCHPHEITAMIQYQVGALDGICRAHGIRVAYVKPHGALYTDMMRDTAILGAVMEGVVNYDPGLPLMVMTTADNNPVRTLANDHGIQVLFEAFADRAYDDRGYLLPRSHAGAVHHDADRIVAQALALASGGIIHTQDGIALQLEADTLCVHGDNDQSIQAVAAIRAALDELYERDTTV